MADMRNFSDVDGVTRELAGYVQPMANAAFAARWPGVKARRYDGFARMVAYAADDPGGELWPVTRSIEYKRNPSKHKCGARCLSATGSQCECQCNGKNHGAGRFSCD